MKVTIGCLIQWKTCQISSTALFSLGVSVAIVNKSMMALLCVVHHQGYFLWLPRRAEHKDAFTPRPHYHCSWLARILSLSFTASIISSFRVMPFNYRGALMNSRRPQWRHCGQASSLRLMSQRANNDDQGCLQSRITSFESDFKVWDCLSFCSLIWPWSIHRCLQ